MSRVQQIPRGVALLRRAWPGAREVWRQLHWLIGITAGSVLMLIGLSGGVIAFRDELTDWLSPGSQQVPIQAQAALSPSELLQRLHARAPDQVLGTMALFNRPGAAVRVSFAPAAGQRRGETVYLDPYTAAELPPLRGDAFFEWMEDLHRWLLLPREPGRLLTGSLALCLLFLTAVGLYLRWPRRPLDWRVWFTVDSALRGRPFWWALHAVVGTVVLPAYLLFALTGIYWGFDNVRDWVDVQLAGQAPRMRAAPTKAAPRTPAGTSKNQPLPDISRAWSTFNRTTAASGGWSEVTLRTAGGAKGTVAFTWLDRPPAHDRARNRMTVALLDGAVTQDERYLQKTTAAQLVASFRALHTGSYFDWPGRVVMMLASLSLPLLGTTGWLLYLDRRRKKRAVWLARRGLAHARPGDGGQVEPLLLAFASQSGMAEGIALSSAAALEAAGVPVTLRSLAQITPSHFQAHKRALIVASTFGEGEPPDTARRFLRDLCALGHAARLASLQYGLLALGDRNYERFCGFGHSLHHAFRLAGAAPMFEPIEVDRGSPTALADWMRQLQALAGPGAVEMHMATEAGVNPVFTPWRLTRRELLNPGSQGAPLFRITLRPPAGAPLPVWQAGALVELQPPPADADGVEQPAPRRYSVASLQQDGEVQLLVRQARSAHGLGLASGWLTARAPDATEVPLRLLANPSFAAADHEDGPAIFIGNGSGYAGLRGHLLQRQRAGRHRNWVLFGERQRAVDGQIADELLGWLAAGWLHRVDLAFSRDQPERRYVQHVLREQAVQLRAWIADGAVVYVCGSLKGMGRAVEAELVAALGAEQVDVLMAQRRLRRDLY